MKFKELEKGKINEIESKYASYWDKEDILNKSITNRDNNEMFVFFQLYLFYRNFLKVLCSLIVSIFLYFPTYLC